MSLIESYLKRNNLLCYSDQMNVLYDPVGSEDDILNARELIEGHFDGETVEFRHHSGDPQLAVDRELDGEEFVSEVFDGDYEKAFNYIKNGKT